MIRAIQFQNKRVGSTFLQKALNTHTDIVGIDEVFVNVSKKAKYRKSGFIPFVRPENKFKKPKNYLRNYIYKAYPDKNTAFKLMYNQIEYHAGIMNYITVNNIPIIHLMRKNIVKQIVSGLTAARTIHKPYVKIQPNQFFNMVVQADNENKSWENKLKDHIRLTLYYEDIIGKNEGEKTYLSPNANIAVCNFFEVEQQQLYSTTKKKNKEDISVYLPNYDAIKKQFIGTKYQWMVED
jgi:hypothetical protein